MFLPYQIFLGLQQLEMTLCHAYLQIPRLISQQIHQRQQTMKYYHQKRPRSLSCQSKIFENFTGHSHCYTCSISIIHLASTSKQNICCMAQNLNYTSQIWWRSCIVAHFCYVRKIGPTLETWGKWSHPATLLSFIHIIIFISERVILSRAQVLVPIVLKPRPIPMPAVIGYSLPRGRGEL